MRFYIGIICIITGALMMIASSIFLDFTILFEKLVAVLFFALSTIMLLFGLNNLYNYLDYKRVVKHGFKVKAKIIHIKSTVLKLKDSPKFILEVIYEHPFNHKSYKTFVDYYGEVKQNLNVSENEIIDVLIDPKNPNIALFSKG